MAESLKLLYYRREDVTYSIKTYTDTADVGSDYLGLNIGGTPYYAKLGATNDVLASHLRVQKGGAIMAVLVSI